MGNLVQNLEKLKEINDSSLGYITQNESQNELMRQAQEIEFSVIKNIIDYEAQQKILLEIQKEVNKFDKENIIPLKRYLKYLADDVLGQYQKEHSLYIKDLKKMKENDAIKLDIIQPKENFCDKIKLGGISNEQKKIILATEKINSRIELLSNNEALNKNEIFFLKDLLKTLN